jgi:hypothetical protein
VIALADVLGVLVAAIADAVAARLGATARDAYTSLDLPPHTTRRRFREVLSSGRVAGATKDGAVWTCSRAAWDAARRRPPRVATAATTSASVATSRTADVDRLLRASGLRVIGGPR